MLKVTDIITGHVFEYDDVEDFRRDAKDAFDGSVHADIDRLCDAIAQGQPLGEFETFLGVSVEW